MFNLRLKSTSKYIIHVASYFADHDLLNSTNIQVVQGGKADSSGNIHVGDEILAVNGFEFDNEQQATDYVKVAKKELVLKVKR